jgi:hypothetical protein
MTHNMYLKFSIIIINTPWTNTHCVTSALRASNTELPQLSMRYCPPYSAPNKAGRPKDGKRTKGILEEIKPKRRKGGW